MRAYLAILLVVAMQSVDAAAAPGLRHVVKGDKARTLPALAQTQLAKEGSVVVAGAEPHFFALHDRNAYLGIPNFVTLDAVLHVFHVRMDDLLVRMEVETAVPELERFAAAQLAAALALFPGTGLVPDRLRRLALFHAVPLLLLDAQRKLDPRIAMEAAEEVKRIQAGTGLVQLGVCPRKMDVTLLQPRGHYARDELQGYFSAFSFYAACGFDLHEAGQLERAVDIVRLLDPESRSRLERLRALATLMTGPADDPGVTELSRAIPVDIPALPAALTGSTQTRIATQVGSLQPGKVPAQTTPGETPRVEFRLLGAAGVPDSVLFARTTSLDTRPFPSALDLLAGLGSPLAHQLLADDVKRFLEMKDALDAPLPLDGRGLYGRWLEVLRKVVQPVPASGPAFQQSKAWSQRLLVTAAGSWAELRHDTLLYVKQPLVMKQGGHPDSLPPSPGGYVEPRPEIYLMLRAILDEVCALLPSARDEMVTSLQGWLDFLVTVSRMELAGAPIPRDMDERLRLVGHEMEQLTRGRGHVLPDQALVADVFTVADEGGRVRAFHVGTGAVDELWVRVPRGKQQVLMRGGVFSYYEFAGEPGARLDDTRWLRMLREHRAPARPSWASMVVAAPPVKRRTKD